MPGLMCLCKKNELAKLHAKFLKQFPDEEPFIPETFSLPSERKDAMIRISEEKKSENDLRELSGSRSDNLWILKPCIKSGQLKLLMHNKY